MKIRLILIIAAFIATGAKSQESSLQFDTAQFSTRLQLAGKLVDQVPVLLQKTVKANMPGATGLNRQLTEIFLVLGNQKHFFYIYLQ